MLDFDLSDKSTCHYAPLQCHSISLNPLGTPRHPHPTHWISCWYKNILLDYQNQTPVSLDVWFYISDFINDRTPQYSVRGYGSGVNWADVMAAQGAFGTIFLYRSILRPKHRACYRSGRPVIKIGPKGALGSHEIRPIHSAQSLGQSILMCCFLSIISQGMVWLSTTLITWLCWYSKFKAILGFSQSDFLLSCLYGTTAQ